MWNCTHMIDAAVYSKGVLLMRGADVLIACANSQIEN